MRYMDDLRELACKQEESVTFPAGRQQSRAVAARKSMAGMLLQRVAATRQPERMKGSSMPAENSTNMAATAKNSSKAVFGLGYRS